MSLRTVAPVRLSGTDVMERSFRLGGRAEEGRPIVLVRPVLCPLQVTTFVNLTNGSFEHHSPMSKPLCRVPRALASVRFTVFHWDFEHVSPNSTDHSLSQGNA